MLGKGCCGRNLLASREVVEVAEVVQLRGAPCSRTSAMTAYITGTSTRRVDDLVRALGRESGVSKSTVPRICKGIDDEVEVFRTRHAKSRSASSGSAGPMQAFRFVHLCV